MVEVKRALLDPADVAVSILRGRKAPIATKELIQLVYKELFPKGAANEVRAKAEIHTALSMDGRLTRKEKAWALHQSQGSRLKPVRLGTRIVKAAPKRHKLIEDVESDEEDIDLDDEEFVEDEPLDEDEEDLEEMDEREWD